MKIVIVCIALIAAAMIGVFYIPQRQAKREESEIVRNSLYPLQERLHNRIKNGDEQAIDDLAQMLTTNDKYDTHKKQGLMLFWELVVIPPPVEHPPREANACVQWLEDNRKNLHVSSEKKRIILEVQTDK